MKKEKEITNIKNTQKIKLSRCFRFFIYLIFLCLQLLMNVSTGMLSIGSKYIKESLNMSDTKYGFFSLFFCSGKIFCSFLFIFIKEGYDRKRIIFLSAIIHSITAIGFKLTSNYIILFFLRFFMGFSIIPIRNYLPEYINQFGIHFLKNAQMVVIPLSESGGKNTGYLLFSLLGEKNWKMGFLLQGVFLVFVAFIILVSNQKYFSKTLFPKTKEGEKKMSNSSSSFEEIDKERKDNKNDYEENEELKVSMPKEFYLSLHNSLFILCMICYSIITGLNAGLDFWISDFLRNRIKINSNIIISNIYSSIGLCGLLGGALLNILFKLYIGNYNSRKSSWLLVGIQILASIFAIFSCLTVSIISFLIAIISFFIFNYLAISILQIILNNCIERSNIDISLTITSMSSQLISGIIPILYGYLNEIYKSKYSYLAMLCMLSFNIVTVPIFVFTAFLRNKNLDFEEKNKERLIKKDNPTAEEEELEELNDLQ